MVNNPMLTITSLIATLCITVGCRSESPPSLSQAATTTTTANLNQTIVLGDVSDNPRKKIRNFQPLANYLGSHLREFDHGKVKIAPDMETMISWLQSGEVDIYIDSPYPAMMAINNANAKPILRRWKKGTSKSHSLIFTMSDRQINSLADLTGKIVAFDHPTSTTGYMLPLTKLLESGVTPVAVKSASSYIAEDAVGYVFSYEDENSIEWLLSNKVAAVAIDNHSYNKLPVEIKDQTVILGKTEAIARNLVLVNQEMSSAEIKDLTSTLLEMDQTAEGKAVLGKFGRTTKFDNFPFESDLARIQQLYQQVQK